MAKFIDTTINLIVNATNRKKRQPEVNLADYSARNIYERVKAWTDALDSFKGDLIPVKELYAGDHWSMATLIPTLYPQLKIC
jgi:hypothetical protein